MKRLIKNTYIKFTAPSGEIALFGDYDKVDTECHFPLHSLSGLNIGTLENNVIANGTRPGEIDKGQIIRNRVIEIGSEWKTVKQREKLTQFFIANTYYSFVLTFNDKNYYGRCRINESYSYEDNEGNIFTGSDISLSMYFPDPYLYTDSLYNYDMSAPTAAKFKYYNLAQILELPSPPDGEPIIFSVNNEDITDIEVEVYNPMSESNGVTINLRAFGQIKQPEIKNLATGDRLKFLLTMENGDLLHINTKIGEIQALLNGVNVMKYTSLDSKFFEIIPGLNKMVIIADSGVPNVKCSLEFRGKVGAV